MITPKTFATPDELWGFAIDIKAEVVKFQAYNQTFFYDISSHQLNAMQEIWRRAIYQFAIYGTCQTDSTSKLYSMKVEVLKDGNAQATCDFAMIRLVPDSGSDTDTDEAFQNAMNNSPVSQNKLWDHF